MGARLTDRPLIGLTTSEVRRAEEHAETPQGEPLRHEMALGVKYHDALQLAGGLPVILPPLEPGAIEPLLDRLGGICMSGGPDLTPEAYGARRHPELGPTEPDIDRFELELARAADARRMPILAICRGAQVLNVARGGTLVQHLPERAGASIRHRQAEPSELPTHPVDVAPDTLLARALRAVNAEVNSFHHQAAERLGRGLRAVAWSPDGVVEGVEAVDRDFVLGVQWHAEGLVERPEQAALFAAFVGAARDYGAPDARVRAA